MDSDVLNMEIWTHSYITPTLTYIPMCMWGLRVRNKLTGKDHKTSLAVRKLLEVKNMWKSEVALATARLHQWPCSKWFAGSNLWRQNPSPELAQANTVSTDSGVVMDYDSRHPHRVDRVDGQ